MQALQCCSSLATMSRTVLVQLLSAPPGSLSAGASGGGKPGVPGIEDCWARATGCQEAFRRALARVYREVRDEATGHPGGTGVNGQAAALFALLDCDFYERYL